MIMSIIFHTLVLLLAFAGSVALNDNGGFTSSPVRKAIGTAIHLIAIILTIYLYGTMRGLFVYTGLLSLLAIAYTMLKK